MANTYTNAKKDLTTNSATVLYTAPSVTTSIVKSGGGSVVKSGGGKLATKGGALAKVKKTGKEIVKQTPSALANRDKGGALTKPEPQKQGEQSKGIDIKMRMPTNRKTVFTNVNQIKNPQ